METKLTDKIQLTRELKVLLLQVLKAKEMTKDQADKLVKILTDADAASNAFEAKFPQLKQFDKTPELADLNKRFGEAGLALLGALAKADDKFKGVPEFAEVMKKIMKTDAK